MFWTYSDNFNTQTRFTYENKYQNTPNAYPVNMLGIRNGHHTTMYKNIAITFIYLFVK